MNFEGYLEMAERNIELRNYSEAKRNFAYARRINRNDWRVWFGLAQALTHNFTVHTAENWSKFISTALSLTNDDSTREHIKNAVGSYGAYHESQYQEQYTTPYQGRQIDGETSNTWIVVVVIAVLVIILIAAI